MGKRKCYAKVYVRDVPLQFAAKVGSGAGHESRQFF